MSRWIVYALVLLFTSPIWAKDDKRGKNNILVEPFLSYESGDYEFEDLVDKGTFSAIGIGARAGYQYSIFYIGGEAYYSIPFISSDESLSQATREQYFLADEYMVHMGGTAALRMGRLTIFGTLYFDSQLKGTVENDVLTEPDGDYTYYGVGSRIGLEFRVFKGLTIGVSFTSYSFDQYKLNADVNTLTKTDGKQDRPALEMTGTMFNLIYNWPIAVGK